MRILTICPSKYPEKLERMIDSYTVTSSIHTNIIINYEEKSITRIFNEIFEKNPNYDFYFMANDDIIFNTPLWDKILANKGKISYGNDLLQGEHLCPFPMIDGDIVRALGWLQMPMLEKYCGDLCWMTMGKQLDILNYKENVTIKHEWSGEVDEVVHKRDQAEFAKWLSSCYRDVNKIKGVL